MKLTIEEIMMAVNMLGSISATRNDTIIVLEAIEELAELREQGCKVHAGQIHGGEANELRRGIEEFLGDSDIEELLMDSDTGVRAHAMLQELLDNTDARDSLAHLEKAVDLKEFRGECAKALGLLNDEDGGPMDLTEAEIVEHIAASRRIGIPNAD